MRLFTCFKCSNTVYFESVSCIHCGQTLAYFPEPRVVTAVEALPNPSANPSPDAKACTTQTPAKQPTLYRALDGDIVGVYRMCANSSYYGVCNSMVRASDPEELCEACRLNDVIPDLSDPEAVSAWQTLERAKRRLLFNLKELKLPIDSRQERPNGLQFSFMKDSPDNKVFTGHNDGLITINIAEADDPFREKLRKQLKEGYRTVLGHFRHEIGHYYWDRLVKGTDWLPAFRNVFGDESYDYGQAVKRHYAQGAPKDWPKHYVSAYATMHPWEDWAETWAHYMHLVDTLETAQSYGLVLRAPSTMPVSVRTVDFDDFDELIAAWLPLTLALNSLNRSMGLIDPYPFVLVDDVIAKLRFVHDILLMWDRNDAKEQRAIKAWTEFEAYKRPQPEPEPEQPTPEQPAPEQPEPNPEQPAPAAPAPAAPEPATPGLDDKPEPDAEAGPLPPPAASTTVASQPAVLPADASSQAATATQPCSSAADASAQPGANAGSASSVAAE